MLKKNLGKEARQITYSKDLLTPRRSPNSVPAGLPSLSLTTKGSWMHLWEGHAKQLIAL